MEKWALKKIVICPDSSATPCLNGELLKNKLESSPSPFEDAGQKSFRRTEPFGRFAKTLHGADEEMSELRNGIVARNWPKDVVE